jgi:nucleotide-binding universal stress UspA family protein
MSAGIVVGYDGSDCAKEAVRVAIEVGKAYGERVVIAFGYELNPVAGELHDYHAAVKELATKRLTEDVALASEAGAGPDAAPALRSPGARRALSQLAAVDLVR